MSTEKVLTFGEELERFIENSPHTSQEDARTLAHLLHACTYEKTPAETTQFRLALLSGMACNLLRVMADRIDELEAGQPPNLIIG